VSNDAQRISDQNVADGLHTLDVERTAGMRLDKVEHGKGTEPTTSAVLERPLLRTVERLAVPERASERAVVVRNVSKAFKKGRRRLALPFRTVKAEPSKGVRALDDVSLDVRRNEIYGILGANGSGKSTLIRLMSTLLIPDSGDIAVFGYDVREHEMQVKRLINRVSVEASFFKKLSAMENLLYAMRLYGRSGNALRVEITKILVELGIGADRVNQPLEQMSRGMQQKVAIARAFLTSPVLLLLDEPTTGLDPRSKKDVQRFVHDLRQPRRDDHHLHARHGRSRAALRPTGGHGPRAPDRDRHGRRTQAARQRARRHSETDDGGCLHRADGT